MYNTVFISHSKDDTNVDFFHKVFSGIKTEAIWMEYEIIIPPPWDTIRTNVNKSDAVFVLLSNPLLNQLHTNNWVSFETGLAANCRKPTLTPAFLQSLGLDVYVFEPIDATIDFPVPYCTYYMRYSKTTEELRFLQEMIEAAPLHDKGESVKCPYNNCGVEFKMLIDIEQFVCPACRRSIVFRKPMGV